MDKLDTEILNEIQWTFPLVAKPFDEIAKKFEISSDEVKEKLIQLKRKEMQKADDVADKEDDDEDYEPNGLDADDICKICRWPRRDHTTKNLGHSPDC